MVFENSKGYQLKLDLNPLFQMDTTNEKINADFAGCTAFPFEDAILSQQGCKRWSVIYTKQTLAAW